MGKINEWKKEILNHKILIIISILFLIIAIMLDYIAGMYVAKISGVAAPDLILNNIPTVDLDFIYLYGGVLIIALLFLYPLFFRVKKLHIVISQFSLLVIVRGIFTCFTHLAIPTEALQFTVPKALFLLNFSNDLFFSGHTAFPFLGFLLFKGDKIRYVFLVLSILMGTVVLFMHVHYSIDVFSAFFITYGTFKIGEWFFNKINHYK
jgi:hypothetical protein